MDHYQLLGVDSKASHDDIRAAYRKLVKQYHPDVNSSPEAHARMAQINVAYAILSNPSKRAAYDAWVSEPSYEKETAGSYGDGTSGSYTHGESPHATRQSSEFLTCDRCGITNETLTAAVFEYIVPLVVLVQKRYRAGVFCAHCRLLLSVCYTFEVLLLGWLGGLFGMIWSVGAFLKNVRGGEAPAEANAAITWNLALLFIQWHDFAKALYAAKRSRSYQDTADVNRLISQIEQHVGPLSSAGPGFLQRHPVLLNLGIMAAIVIAISLTVVLSEGNNRGSMQPPEYVPAVGYSQPQRGYHSHTESVRDSRVEHVDRLASEVDELESELEWLQSDIEDAGRTIENYEDDIRLGLQEPDYHYEQMIDEHNDKVDEYNAKLEECRAKIDEHNEIARQLR